MRPACARLAMWLATTLGVGSQAHAQARAADARPTLHAAAVELGVAASLVTVEGSTQAQAVLRGGPFFGAGTGLLSIQGDFGFARVRSLRQLDVQATVAWQTALSNGLAWPYVAVGGGVQPEWVGSFRTVRFPIGFDLGLRTLLGQHAGLRAEYRWRRLLDDPVRNFTQHRITVGISLFLNNG